MTAPATTASVSPFFGHSGVPLNDRLRGFFGQQPQLAQVIIQKQHEHERQKQQEQRHREEAAQLAAARAQIAAISASQQQATATPEGPPAPEAPDTAPSNPKFTDTVKDSFHYLLGR